MLAKGIGRIVNCWIIINDFHHDNYRLAALAAGRVSTTLTGRDKDVPGRTLLQGREPELEGTILDGCRRHRYR